MVNTKNTSVRTNSNVIIALCTKGLAFAKHYSRQANHVVIGACRNAKDARELRQEGCLVIEVDVSSDESCDKRLCEQLRELQIEHVDLLINNAGVGMYDDLTTDNLTQNALLQFNVNALGPLRVTKALLPFLRKSPVQAKVVNLSSKMGSLANNLSGRYYGYRASKAAENMISLSLSRDLGKDNIACLLINPGLIKTQMNGHSGDMDAEEAVEMMVGIIEAGRVEDGTKFINRDGNVLDW